MLIVSFVALCYTCLVAALVMVIWVIYVMVLRGVGLECVAGWCILIVLYL